MPVTYDNGTGLGGGMLPIDDGLGSAGDTRAGLGAGGAGGGAFPGEAIAAGIIQSAGAVYAANKASEQAYRNRKWQEDMSNSAHQREVADLRAAGLNPILSGLGGSGASTPAGNTSSWQNPGEGLAQGIYRASQMSRTEMPVAAAQVNEAQARTRNTDAQTAGIPTQLQLQSSQTAKNLADAANTAEQTKNEANKAKVTGIVGDLASDARKGLAEVRAWLDKGGIGNLVPVPSDLNPGTHLIKAYTTAKEKFRDAWKKSEQPIEQDYTDPMGNK